jgi:hypothetical protein
MESESDQVLYCAIFLLFALMVYRQMCGRSSRRYSRLPRPAYSFEAMDIGTDDSGDSLTGEDSSFGGTNIRGRKGNDSLVGTRDASQGGCPINARRQQENLKDWNMSGLGSGSYRSEEDVEMNESYRTVDYSQMGMNTTDQVNKSCYPQTILSSKELLPADLSASVKDFDTAPGDLGQGILDGISYIDAGFHIGVNTVGQSLRNANRQLRSEPANPQVAVSPWLMSTIAPDLERKPLGDQSCSV